MNILPSKSVVNTLYKYRKLNKEITILQLHPEIFHFEAHAREYALIKSIGIDNLCNLKNGVPYGIMKRHWNVIEVSNFGTMLLYHSLVTCIRDHPIGLM